METTSLAKVQQIELLEGPNNWLRWERQMTEFLGFSGFARYLAGRPDAVEPREVEGESAKEKATRRETWEQNQDKAIWTILSRCGANAKAVLEGGEGEQMVTRVAAAFELLRARFRPTGSAVFQNLHQEYKNITLDTCKGTVSDFAERLRKAKSELEALDTSVKIAEPFFVDHFLSGLNNNYATFLATFHQTHSLIAKRKADNSIETAAVSFEEAVQAAERFEQGLKNHLQTKDFALIAQIPGQRKRKGPCSFCKHQGHEVNDCYKKFPHLREIWKRSDAGKAWLARKAKTQAAQTPMVGGLAHQRPLPEFEEGGFGFMASQGPHALLSNWALDTGCSRHISSERSAFLPESLQPYTGPPMVGLGGASQQSMMVGTIQLIICVDGEPKRLRLSDALYSPTAGCNLVSVSQLQKRGAIVNFTPTGISVSTPKGLTAHCDQVHGLYFFRLWAQPVALAAYSLNQD